MWSSGKNIITYDYNNMVKVTVIVFEKSIYVIIYGDMIVC